MAEEGNGNAKLNFYRFFRFHELSDNLSFEVQKKFDTKQGFRTRKTFAKCYLITNWSSSSTICQIVLDLDQFVIFSHVKDIVV